MLDSGYRSRASGHTPSNFLGGQQRSSLVGRPVSPSSSITRARSPSTSTPRARSPSNAAVRARSPAPDSTVSSNSSSLSNDSAAQHRVPRRAVPMGAKSGQSVAELQQRFQPPSLQPQQTPQRLRSPSPTPSRSIQRKLSFITPHADNNSEVDVPEEASIISTSDQSSAVPSIISVSTQSTSVRQSMPSSQEPKVAKEGWLYKKNSLLQWKPVYAVARHGNAVKPGGLYLYKDEKFTSHVHTYDMSEVIQVEPWRREEKSGAKWELRMQVKREDIMLATDTIQVRKEWIDSLTAIMGKISMAAHSELQSRTMSAEQMNRDLQREVEELRIDNDQLRQQLGTIQDEHSHDMRNLEAERVARENGLRGEMEHKRETLESERSRLESELRTWRNKALQLEEQHETAMKKMRDEHKAKVDALERDVRKWRTRAELFEERSNDVDSYENVAPKKYGSSSRFGGRDEQIQDTIKDVKYSLQALRDQVKSTTDSNPLVQGHILDIKSNVGKLCESLEDARLGWNELQADIVRFLEAETEDNQAKEASQVRAMDKLRVELMDLKEGLLGTSKLNQSDNASEQGDGEGNDMPTMSLYAKLDALTSQMNKLQHGQDQLLTAYHDTRDKSSNKEPKEFKVSITAIQDALAGQRKQLEVMDTQSNTVLTKVDDVGVASKDLFDNVITVLQSSMDDIKDEQRQGQEKYENNLKVLGELLQHVVAKIDHGRSGGSITNGASHDSLVTMRSLVRSGDLSSDPTMDEIRELVTGTRGFMERTLRVLDRFGGSHAGMEETVRRAVKSAFNSHLDVNWQEAQKADNTEEKLKRYEENAQKYIDKSMSGMREHLEEYTGVMYKMIEDLVLRAVEHLEQQQQQRQSV